jgi:hypothetical protein
VLIHQGLHCSCSSNRDKAQASNLRPIFWQRGIAVFAAAFCYAKITPAALQRGEFCGRCDWHAEALGPKRKSGAGDFWRTASGPVLPIAETPWMAPS